jgi:hypothetical protein
LQIQAKVESYFHAKHRPQATTSKGNLGLAEIEFYFKAVLLGNLGLAIVTCSNVRLQNQPEKLWPS